MLLIRHHNIKVDDVESSYTFVTQGNRCMITENLPQQIPQVPLENDQASLKRRSEITGRIGRQTVSSAGIMLFGSLDLYAILCVCAHACCMALELKQANAESKRLRHRGFSWLVSAEHAIDNE